MKRLIETGIDRILVGVVAFVALHFTPYGAGLSTWAGIAVCVGCVLYAGRPE